MKRLLAEQALDALRAEGEDKRNEDFEGNLGAMMRAMRTFLLDEVYECAPHDVIAAEWVEQGFTPSTAAAWWVSRCFEPTMAAELRDAGIDPRDVGWVCAMGDTIGYHHAYCDLTLDDVQELIRK